MCLKSQKNDPYGLLWIVKTEIKSKKYEFMIYKLLKLLCNPISLY
ncbi:protein of unknown function [Candidatus Nitrosocosmicus franklandus]|uniref:Uncharacterized protein n=1 Tax=Candidatus Nitrosocosmicus franklandianus TaxID=1798806 RepID=A0A484IBJ2_9ARCH|nr:protein of unknown function [Candidatus Nitrosocosmicus franklandus]